MRRSRWAAIAGLLLVCGLALAQVASPPLAFFEVRPRAGFEVAGSLSTSFLNLIGTCENVQASYCQAARMTLTAPETASDVYMYGLRVYVDGRPNSGDHTSVIGGVVQANSDGGTTLFDVLGLEGFANGGAGLNVGLTGFAGGDGVTATPNARYVGVRGIGTDLTAGQVGLPFGGWFTTRIGANPTVASAVVADSVNGVGDIFTGISSSGGSSTTPLFWVRHGGATNLLLGVEKNVAGVGSPNILVTPNESYKVLTNEGVTAKNFHTLPAAADGVASATDAATRGNTTYTFYVQDADGLRVTAGAGDTIRIAAAVSAAAGFCESTTIGNAVTLVAINATEWVAIATVGSGWTCG